MSILRKPEWLKSNKLGRKRARNITSSLRKYNLHSVCEEAQCPNKGECFERGTATFIILGDTCTRNCKFCAVKKSKTNLEAPDQNEPESIANFVSEQGLKYVVITTVTRDDLDDGGAGHFEKVINAIREKSNEVKIEVLISDLQGNHKNIEQIVKAKPDVFNHNIETVEDLYSAVRPMANYHQSLDVLSFAKELNPKLLTKSGIMVGLGESKDQVIKVMSDLRDANVDFLTIGQYMQPSKSHFPVVEYVHPSVFEEYKIAGEKLGFKMIESAPLVRSSYHAEKAINFIEKFD